MKKSLSEQICEACGIEPKYRCKNVPCLNFMADSGICMLKDGFTKCNPEICKDDYTPDTNHRNWKETEAVYPDFENNNNNFVKLGEIKICDKDYKTIFYLVNYLSENSWETKKDFLRFLIDILSEDTPYIYYSKLKQSIIKAIRRTNWED